MIYHRFINIYIQRYSRTFADLRQFIMYYMTQTWIKTKKFNTLKKLNVFVNL